MESHELRARLDELRSITISIDDRLKRFEDEGVEEIKEENKKKPKEDLNNPIYEDPKEGEY